jgi:ribosomal protein S18 acetylase RimI-like enzyme
MVNQVQTLLRQAGSKDLQQLANHIHFETHVHRHLDYRPPLDWIENYPFLVLERNGEIIASLACPPDPPSVAWIRLFTASSRISATEAWETLWIQALTGLGDNHDLQWAAAVPVHNWFAYQLKKSGFEETHQIVMLSWEGSKLPEKPRPIPATIRSMKSTDLVDAQKIDEASFVPIWQNSLSCLKYAFEQSVIATVAEAAGKLIGYQISMATSQGGHLARLAVDPGFQGKGIGYALVCDLLSRFERRGTRILTVNTQKNNLTSLAMYKKASFVVTGEEYPIYQYKINGYYKNKNLI